MNSLAFKNFRHCTKRIGVVNAMDYGITGSVSAVGRMILGVIGGLPIEAIAVSSTFSFLLAGLLELPTGAFADIFGKARLTVLGYICQAVASLCLFAAITISITHTEFMWGFIIAETVFDALGCAFVSGAREALFQNIISKSLENEVINAKSRELALETGLLQSEQFGKSFSFLTPIIGLAIALSFYYLTGSAGPMLLIHALAWIFLAWQIYKLNENHGDPANNEKTVLVPKWIQLAKKSFAAMNAKARGAWFLGSIGLFLVITVEGFYLVSVMREPNIRSQFPIWFPAMLITLASASGNLARAMVIPKLTKHLTNMWLVVVGLSGATILAATSYSFMHTESVTNLLLMFFIGLPLFKLFYGMVNQSTLGLLLAHTPSEVHASVVSIRSASALALVGIYSAVFSFLGAAPTPSQLFCINGAISAGLLVCAVFILRRNEVKN